MRTSMTGSGCGDDLLHPEKCHQSAVNADEDSAVVNCVNKNRSVYIFLHQEQPLLKDTLIAKADFHPGLRTLRVVYCSS